MPCPESPPPRGTRHADGFALVVTLSLMILLVLLAVGLLSLSSVALRGSGAEMHRAEARANARLALMLAIGELQQQLGPDRRVNANASILADRSGSAIPAGRRHWLGVYDSWDSTSGSARPAPEFRRWMVSGADSTSADESAPKMPPSGQDVTFWNGAAADGADRVSVPKQEIASGKSGGAFAWWVGDENSKALVDRMPQDMGRLSRAWSDVQAAPVAAFPMIPALAGIDRKSKDLSKLVSQSTVDLVAAAPTASRMAFHDFTAFSQGVLSDVARGGLKRDLSLFLDHPVAKPAAPKLPNERRLYPNGITWEELWLFHNVWRELEPPAAGLVSMTGGDLANSLVLMTRPGTGMDSVNAFWADPFAIYKLPTWLRAQWLISVWAEKKPGSDPDGDSQYDLFWVTDGILTFWNPTDVPIALHSDAYTMFRFWYIPYTLQLFDAAGPVTQADDLLAGSTGGAAYHMICGTGPTMPDDKPAFGTPDPVILMPGEVLIMSEAPGGSGPIKYGGGNNVVAMKAGLNLGRGRSKKAILLKPVTGSASLKFRATPNARLFNKAMINLTSFYGTDNLNYGSGNRWASDLGKNATNFPDVFPTVSGDLPSISSMTGAAGKHPVFLLSHQTKSEDSATAWSRMFDPRGLQASLVGLDALPRAVSGQEVQVDGLSGSKDSKMVQLSVNQENRGLFGGSYWDHSRGVDTIVTQSIPREPPVSLGAFQHAIAVGRTGRSSGGMLRSVVRGVAPEISHAIANSYAVPVLGPAATGSSDYQDHSYHVNRMLWDSWFCSGIVQRQARHHDVKKTAREAYVDFLADPSVPLANRRMIPRPAAVADGAGALFSGNGDAKPDAHETASSKLMVQGAFNVNSTSVEAWKAVLGSMEEAYLPVVKGTNAPGSIAAHSTSESEVPVAALLTAHGDGSGGASAAFDDGALAFAGTPAQWRGYRKLTESGIGELAEAMVEEIRARGPFLSMADFINRRPSSDTKTALCGPLQAALDRTVNKTLFAANGRVGIAPADANYPFPEAAELPKSAIAPAQVLQADILTSIGSQLTVHSDTFRIRAYGESKDRTGKVLASAWCEAIVQRVPEYLDPADPPQAAEAPSPDPEPRAVPALTSPLNRNLGRRLEIRSFRWLSPDETRS